MHQQGGPDGAGHMVLLPVPDAGVFADMHLLCTKQGKKKKQKHAGFSCDTWSDPPLHQAWSRPPPSRFQPPDAAGAAVATEMDPLTVRASVGARLPVARADSLLDLSPQDIQDRGPDHVRAVGTLVGTAGVP